MFEMPTVGAPVMLAAPLAASDIPLKATAWECPRLMDSPHFAQGVKCPTNILDRLHHNSLQSGSAGPIDVRGCVIEEQEFLRLKSDTSRNETKRFRIRLSVVEFR